MYCMWESNSESVQTRVDFCYFNQVSRTTVNSHLFLSRPGRWCLGSFSLAKLAEIPFIVKGTGYDQYLVLGCGNSVLSDTFGYFRIQFHTKTIRESKALGNRKMLGERLLRFVSPDPLAASNYLSAKAFSKALRILWLGETWWDYVRLVFLQYKMLVCRLHVILDLDVIYY